MPLPIRPTVPVGQPFDDWTADDAKSILQATKDERVGSTEYGYNKAYAEEGDHWQAGTHWVGPRGSDATEGDVLAKVERQFTPNDAIGEVLDGLANALCERAAQISFVPREGGSPDEPTDEQHRLQEAIRAWWETRDLTTLVRTVVMRTAWASWSTLRAWVPPSQLDQPEGSDEDTAPQQARVFPSGLTLEEALDKVFVSAPDPEFAVVYQDPETRDRVGIFRYEFDADTMTELCWPAPDGTTVIRVLNGSGLPLDEDAVVDLGGQLPIVQMEGDLLLTESVRREQAQLNFFTSNMTRVVELAGFPERYTINASPQGTWSTVVPSEGPITSKIDANGTTWYLHPEDRTLGASITTELVGIPMQSVNASGTVESITTPTVTFKEPTDPDYIVKAIKASRLAILRDCKQAHRGMDESDTATGVSRVQARADFLADANTRRVALERMLRQLVEVSLAYAGQMSDEAASLLARYRPQIKVRVSPGPLGQDESLALNERVKAGTLSLERALELFGEEDVSAELDRIRNQPESRLAFHEKAAAVMQQYTSAGLNITAAAKLLGLDEEELAVIEESEAQVQATEDVATDPMTGEPVPNARPGDPAPSGQPAVRASAFMMPPREVPEPDPRIDALMTAVAQLAQQIAVVQQSLAVKPEPQPITVNSPDVTVNQAPIEITVPVTLPSGAKSVTVRRIENGQLTDTGFTGNIEPESDTRRPE